jgi:hypothetical protein
MVDVMSQVTVIILFIVLFFCLEIFVFQFPHSSFSIFFSTSFSLITSVLILFQFNLIKIYTATLKKNRALINSDIYYYL